MEALSTEKMDELVEKAREARDKAYAPYSEFKVGAAVLTASGKIFPGCNVENASYGLTICAERNAVFQAVASGERGIEALAIVADTPRGAPPCGACRQVLAEFADDIPVIVANLEGGRIILSLDRLLPHRFQFED